MWGESRGEIRGKEDRAEEGEEEGMSKNERWRRNVWTDED